MQKLLKRTGPEKSPWLSYIMSWEVAQYELGIQKYGAKIDSSLFISSLLPWRLTQQELPIQLIDPSADYFNTTPDTLPPYFHNLAKHSFDFIALPHLLERSRQPIEILSAVVQKLKPQGHLMLTLFNCSQNKLEDLQNQFQLWGENPQAVYAVPQSSLFYGLHSLGLRSVQGGFACYRPRWCIENKAWSMHSLELIGSRWLPHWGQIFWLDLVKFH